MFVLIAIVLAITTASAAVHLLAPRLDERRFGQHQAGPDAHRG
jgi:hypothetical protein